jgi:hypothetical protein
MTQPYQPHVDIEALAQDLAMELRSPSEVWELHGVSHAEAVLLLRDRKFVAKVEELRKQWQSIDRVEERVTTKAKLALEAAIPALFGIVENPQNPAVARVGAVKQLHEVAGMAKQAQASQTTAGLPSITINIGPRSLEVSGSKELIDVTQEEP